MAQFTPSRLNIQSGSTGLAGSPASSSLTLSNYMPGSGKNRILEVLVANGDNNDTSTIQATFGTVTMSRAVRGRQTSVQTAIFTLPETLWPVAPGDIIITNGGSGIAAFASTITDINQFDIYSGEPISGSDFNGTWNLPLNIDSSNSLISAIGCGNDPRTITAFGTNQQLVGEIDSIEGGVQDTNTIIAWERTGSIPIGPMSMSVSWNSPHALDSACAVAYRGLSDYSSTPKSKIFTVQQGSGSIPADTSSIQIVQGTDAGFETTVDPSKTMIFLTYGVNGTQQLPTVSWPAWTILDGNTIEVARSGSSAASIPFNWFLVSADRGVRVQHKSVTFVETGSGYVTQSISASLENHGRWIVPCGGMVSSGATAGSVFVEFVINGDIVSASIPSNTGIPSKYNYQVIEYEDAVVNQLTFSHAHLIGLYHYDIPLSSSIALNKTAVWGTMRSGGSTLGRIAFQSTFPDTRTLRISRANNSVTGATHNYTIYVVQFDDDVRVINNVSYPSTSLGGSNVIYSSSFFPSVEPSQSIALITGISNMAGSLGITPSTAGLINFSRMSLTTKVVSPTEVHYTEYNTLSETAEWNAQILYFRNIKNRTKLNFDTGANPVRVRPGGPGTQFTLNDL